MSTAAVFDADRDGPEEIVIVRWYSQSPNIAAVHLMDGNGNDLAGWPVEFPMGTYSSPTVGDIDIDGSLEIAAVIGTQIYVLDLGGNVESNWPYNMIVSAGRASPPFGQVEEADEFLETAAVAGSDDFYVLNHDASLLPGWPVDESNVHVITNVLLPSPVFAELDGDGRNDVLICGSSGSSIYAYDENGNPLPGWPRAIPGHGDHGVNNCTAVVADIDRDGDIEVLCAGGDSYLYVWDLEAPTAGQDDGWYSLHYDLRNSRYFDPSPPSSVVTGGQLNTVPMRLGAHPNPFQHRLTLRIDALVPTLSIHAAIYDVEGGLVRDLDTGVGLSSQWIYWDGRGSGGRPSPSGVYFARIKQGSRIAWQKVLLAR
jgi:hypothetical protein